MRVVDGQPGFLYGIVEINPKSIEFERVLDYEISGMKKDLMSKWHLEYSRARNG